MNVRRHQLPAFLQQQRREREDAVELVRAVMERTIRSPRGLGRLVAEHGVLDRLWDSFLEAMDQACTEHAQRCRWSDASNRTQNLAGKAMADSDSADHALGVACAGTEGQ